MSDHVDRALAHLREHGYPNAKREAVAGIAERYPWIARKANGWQQLARLYVERPEWR
jgi:predicted nicotinamide N-methyase